MILLTVGTQLPFDRLVKAIDKWSANNPHVDIFGQIGDGGYVPVNFSYKKFISIQELENLHHQANFVVAHAGMGSILTALKFKKPIIVMPRMSAYSEHRNDHQLSTVAQFKDTSGVYVANDEMDLLGTLTQLDGLKTEDVSFNEFASDELLQNLINFIEGN